MLKTMYQAAAPGETESGYQLSLISDISDFSYQAEGLIVSLASSLTQAHAELNKAGIANRIPEADAEKVLDVLGSFRDLRDELESRADAIRFKMRAG